MMKNSRRLCREGAWLKIVLHLITLPKETSEENKAAKLERKVSCTESFAVNIVAEIQLNNNFDQIL